MKSNNSTHNNVALNNHSEGRHIKRQYYDAHNDIHVTLLLF